MRGNNEDPNFPFLIESGIFLIFSRDNSSYFHPKRAIARVKSLQDPKSCDFNRVARHFSLLGSALLTQSRVFDRSVLEVVVEREKHVSRD